MKISSKKNSIELVVSCAVFLVLANSVIAKPDRSAEKTDKQRHFSEKKKERRERHVQAILERLDKNRDGFIDQVEFSATPRLQKLPEEKRVKIFQRFDKNADGVLDLQELRILSRKRLGPPRDDLKKLDTDQSGGVSYAEFSQGRFASRLPEERRKKVFSRLDRNGDGEITPEEGRRKRPKRQTHPRHPKSPAR